MEKWARERRTLVFIPAGHGKRGVAQERSTRGSFKTLI